MKKRYAGVLLGITITLGSTMLSGCAEKENTSDTGQTIYGQVSEIRGKTITIEAVSYTHLILPLSSCSFNSWTREATVIPSNAMVYSFLQM